MPFVVRTEQGVIDRGIYTIWVLDPNAGGGFWDGTRWNERLVYRFGGGCGTTYTQGSSFVGNADIDLLGHGYAVATNTLDTFQTACNDMLSAETALMTREHFVEQYGVPQFTIGDGGSGGAIQQLMIAHRYPGILDALSPSVPFPDAISIAGGVTDCGLLVNYYGTEFGAALTDEQKQAINGHASTGTCESVEPAVRRRLNPTDGCDPRSATRSTTRDTRPDGVRCTLQDINVNIVGAGSGNGFRATARSTTSGSSTACNALNDGVISVDQFLDLNEHIGGIRHRREHRRRARGSAGGNVAACLRVRQRDRRRPAARRADHPAQPVHRRHRRHPHALPRVLDPRPAPEDGIDDPNLLLWTAPTGDLVAQLLGNVAGGNDTIVLLDEWLTTGDQARGRDQPLHARRRHACSPAAGSCTTSPARAPTSIRSTATRGWRPGRTDAAT